MTALPRPMTPDSRKTSGDVLLGEDWVSPDVLADPVHREGRRRHGVVALNSSPLARKIIIFNLMALVVLVAGVLFMNPFRDSLVLQREQGLVTEAELIADVFEAGLAASGPLTPASAQSLPGLLENIKIAPGVEVFVFDTY
ncbi:MAG: sensor N-terminal transmembrane domain-containing protein, partial [Beijerinckiaceae bacterium]